MLLWEVTGVCELDSPELQRRFHSCATCLSGGLDGGDGTSALNASFRIGTSCAVPRIIASVDRRYGARSLDNGLPAR